MNDAGELRHEAEKRGLPISDMVALKQALTHKSLVPDHPLDSNERLEFVGDSVLGLVVVEWLYTQFPKRGEGELAKAKALIVCKDALAAAARRLDLAPLIRETVAQLGGQATGRPVELHAEAADGLLPVEVDPARLEEMLGWLRLASASSRSALTEADADAMAEAAKTEWWTRNKARFVPEARP